ncbi:hypothetical protein AB2B38_007570 [Balneola sp. MJW-20]|uniref:hypothetical protein n=1 Tax=Gracilimonas aurantiaca TaxID=3234185 RepID=UPI0034652256
MRSYPLFFILIFVLFSACSNEQQTEEAQVSVQGEVQPPDFEALITDLQNKEQTDAVKAELEQAHYDYGIFLIYNADPSQMRENANKALKEFIAVLRLNPDNEKAMAEIDQIMSIYATFPDRSPDEEIVQELRDLGFNY